MPIDQMNSANGSRGDQISQVRALAAAAGLRIAADRLPELTDQWRATAAILADLDTVDLSGTEPVSAFDPSWSDEGGQP